eukprot:GHVS01094450.1.p1 GENE.GHVS01094450.1~~GHVS01094450.1.p1  ORF type:complete len:297 (-),score=75.12 GHVS01094450.1:236-1126(-)
MSISSSFGVAAVTSSPVCSSPETSPSTSLPPLAPPADVLPPAPQIDGTYFPPFPAPSATDAISKLQFLLNNSMAIIAEAMYQLGDTAPRVPHDVVAQITNIAHTVPHQDSTTNTTNSSTCGTTTTDNTTVSMVETVSGGTNNNSGCGNWTTANPVTAKTERQGSLRDCFEDTLVDDISERAHRLALVLGCIQAQIQHLPSTKVPASVDVDVNNNNNDQQQLLSSGSNNSSSGVYAGSSAVLTGSSELDNYYRNRISDLVCRNDEEEVRLLAVTAQLSSVYTDVTDRLRTIAKNVSK